jgi:hypothetical protein
MRKGDDKVFEHRCKRSLIFDTGCHFGCPEVEAFVIADFCRKGKNGPRLAGKDGRLEWLKGSALVLDC